MNEVAQIGIAIFGVTAIWLSQQSCHKRRRWACIFGLASQPFWFYSAWVAEQYGIFALSFLYAWSWGVGFKNNWLNSPEQ